MSDLIDNLITVWDDSVKFFKSLKRLVVVVQSLVDETKVIDSFNVADAQAG
jgi:hypothetical protein